MADRKLKKEEIEELEKRLKPDSVDESRVKATQPAAKPENKTEPKAGGINDPVLNVPKYGKRAMVKCSNCKEIVTPVNEMCPNCNHFINEREIPAYQPLSDKTTKRVKTILFFVLIGVFIALVAVGVVKLGGR